MSVYVPDELWQQVETLDGFKLSTFVQKALRDLVSGRSARPYAQLSSELRLAREATRTHVLAQMAQAYQVGYRVGLEFARHLPWRAFDRFADLNWDLDRWRAEFDEERYPIVNRSDWPKNADELYFEGLMLIVLEDLEPELEVVPLSDDGMPSGLLREGFFDAIRHVWQGQESSEEAAHADDSRQLVAGHSGAGVAADPGPAGGSGDA